MNVAGANDTISIGRGKFTEAYGVTISRNLFINGGGILSTRVQGGWSGYSVVEVAWGATVVITNPDITSGLALFFMTRTNCRVRLPWFETPPDLDVVRIVANSTAFGGALGSTVSGGDCAVSLTVTGSDITNNDSDGIDSGAACR